MLAWDWRSWRNEHIETNEHRPSNREESSLRFETPDNPGNEARGVLGSALLEERFVLRCLSARAITEAA
jgi:hypothetical protein